MESMENPSLLNPPPTSASSAEPQSPPKGSGWKIFLGIILGFSIIANLVLLFALAASIIIFTAGKSDYLLEKAVEEGRGANKIAVIKIEGIINNKLAEDVSQQIKAAKKDKNVKAVIFRTNSPGGGISASDRIYDEICRFRTETGKPAVAFMETVAASGGLYTSCGCDKIIAEPTTITGSIGVIMGTFVLQDLFEQKLGIKPVIIKSGPKKDWPTAFEPVTEEQIQYINEKLISPAYERFVNIVAKSRKDVLTIEQIRVLADGSIYNAPEALENKLIDDIGYMPEAIALAKSLAKITDAKVVEYEKPFSFENFLEAKSIFRIDRDTIYELTTPQLMYLWDAGLKF
jgi:protease-4